MFADFGVPVFFNGTQAAGILDTYTDTFSHGGGPGAFGSVEYVLRLPFNAFSPMPVSLDAITVDGTDFTVRDAPKNQDAAIVELRLKPA